MLKCTMKDALLVIFDVKGASKIAARSFGGIGQGAWFVQGFKPTWRV